MANDKLADYVVQVIKEIGGWNLEHSVYQQAINYSPIPTVASENMSNQNFGKSPSQIVELHNSSTDIFSTSHNAFETLQNISLYTCSNKNQCFKCEKYRQWANDCKSSYKQQYSNNSQNRSTSTTYQKKSCQNPKELFLSLKSKKQKKPRIGQVYDKSQHKNQNFFTNQESSNKNEIKKSAVKRLEDDQVESEKFSYKNT